MPSHNQGSQRKGRCPTIPLQTTYKQTKSVFGGQCRYDLLSGLPRGVDACSNGFDKFEVSSLSRIDFGLHVTRFSGPRHC